VSSTNPLANAMSESGATAEFLVRGRSAIIDQAAATLSESKPRHYQSLDPETIRGRLEALHDQLVHAAASRDLGDVITYARELADERFTAGFDLSEIQTAINALEEAVWTRVFSELQPGQFAETLGLVSTILGAAKDSLAREYVSLATGTHVPSVDLRTLFAGTS
jgi:hypothetical protein